MSKWSLKSTSLYERAFKRYQKKHPDETLAVLSNLDTYFETLSTGVKPLLIRAGFIHHEPLDENE